MHHQQAFGPDTYGPFLGFLAFTMVVIGGLGSTLGVLLGAAYLELTYRFASDLPGDAALWRLFSNSLGVLLVLMILPSGLGGLVYRLRDAALRWVARRRGLVVPSFVEGPVVAAEEPEILDRPDPGSLTPTWSRPTREHGHSPPSGPGPGGRPRRSGTRGRALDELTGPGPVYALLILFGLNAVDELDRTAFGILLPEIREDFGLDLTSILALIAIVAAGALALQIPIAQYSDRHRRVPVALGGAVVWAFFSVMTGLVSTVFMLGVARAGSGIGKAVVDPTHNSLLADYYPPDNRPGVYSFHRAANAVGQFLGPLLAGLLAYWFGWRVPFIVFAIPTIDPRGPRPEDAGAGPGSLGAGGHGGLGRDRRHRGGARLLRRGLAHLLEDRRPPAHLVRPAVPGRVAHRLRDPGLALLRGGVRPQRGGPRARWPPPWSRCSCVGLIIGARRWPRSTS